MAPRIAGPREAAVLARLWADADLILDPSPQGDNAVDLGMSPAEMTNHLSKFRDISPSGGEPLVEEVKGDDRRVALYRITEAGKRELGRWVLAHYSTETLLRHITQVSPDKRKVGILIDLQRADIRKALGVARD